MKKTILKFGLISGIATSVMMAATLPFENQIGHDHSLYVGYTLIVLSFLLSFFGIRSYRENECGGQITFVRAFAVGISIALITCAFYVVTWEIIYFQFMPDYMDKYAAHEVEKARAAGASAAAIQAQIEQARQFKEKYNNVFYNAALTFLEPFPVGLIMTLVSAAILRKRPKSEPAQSPLPAPN